MEGAQVVIFIKIESLGLSINNSFNAYENNHSYKVFINANITESVF